MAYLSLEEINSNPIYQPPQKWIIKIKKQEEKDRQQCIQTIKWLKKNKKDDGCNNIMDKFPNSCYDDLKQFQPSIKYQKGDIIVETNKILDYEVCEDIYDMIKHHLKKSFKQLIFKTYKRRIQKAPFLPRYTDIVISSKTYFKYDTTTKKIKYYN